MAIMIRLSFLTALLLFLFSCKNPKTDPAAMPVNQTVDTIQVDSVFQDSLPPLTGNLTDTNRINAYINQGDQLFNQKNYKAALKYRQQTVKICEQYKMDASKKCQDAYFLLGRNFSELGQFDEGKQYLRKFLQIKRDDGLPDDIRTADVFDGLGFIAQKSSNIDSSLWYFQNALAIKLSLVDSMDEKISHSYNEIGLTHSTAGNYTESIRYLKKALHILEENYDTLQTRIATTYNNIGADYYHQGKLAESMVYYKKSLAIREEHLEEGHADFVESYNNIGSVYALQANLSEALVMIKKALVIMEKNSGEVNPTIAVLYSNLAIYSIKKGDLKNAIQYNDRSMELRKTLYPEIHPEIANSLNTYGNIYISMGDAPRSLQHYIKAQYVLSKTLGPKHPYNAIIFGNISDCYKHLDRYDEGLRYAQKSLNLAREVIGDAYPNLPLIYNNIGDIYVQQSNFEEALAAYEQAIDISVQQLGQDNFHQSNSLSKISQAFLLKKELDKAFQYQQQSIAIKAGLPSQNRLSNARSFENMALIHEKRDEFDLAMSFIHQALAEIKTGDDLSIQSIEDLSLMITLLGTKGEILRRAFDRTERSEYLLAADSVFNDLENLYLQYVAGRRDNQSKQEVLKKHIHHYAGNISTKYQLSQILDQPAYLSQAYQALENSKSSILRGAIANTNALAFSDLQDQLKQREYDLKVDIGYYQQKVFDEKNESAPRDSAIEEYRSKIFDLKQQYEALIDTFEASDPDYYNLKYNNQATSIEEVQKQLLDADHALIEYFISDHSIFIFVITPNQFEVREVKKDFPLEEWIGQLRCGLMPAAVRQDTECEALTETAAQQQYVTAAQKIYQNIFAPIESLLQETQKLIIIPDGPMGYIPFDALIKKPAASPDDFHLHQYLLHDYQISYAYSASLLKEMKSRRHQHSADQPFIAYAPVFKNGEAPLPDSLTLALNLQAPSTVRNETGPLKYNIPEVEAIQAQIGGKIYTDSFATRKAFLTSAAEASILHLSTHGKANDNVGDYSFLAFYQHPDSSLNSSRLYNRDLYNLQLNADMVVLSACETGIGELQQGEGIISMARGFSYAGAKSIVTTLWSVDDASSNKLMTTFYRFLKEGKSKDAALKAAKLELTSNPQYASPYYWAGVIPIGDMRPVLFQSNKNFKWLLAFFIVILLGGILLKVKS